MKRLLGPAFESEHIWTKDTENGFHFQYLAMIEDDSSEILRHVEAMLEALNQLPEGLWQVRSPPSISHITDFLQEGNPRKAAVRCRVSVVKNEDSQL